MRKFLKRRRCARQNRNVLRLRALVNQTVNFRRNPFRFFNSRRERLRTHLPTRILRRMQFFSTWRCRFQTIWIVVLNQGVRRIQNFLLRSIIFRQKNFGSIWIVRPKLQNIINARAAEFINRLIVVAHHRNIFVGPEQRAHQIILRHVRILKLVDNNIFETILQPLSHARALRHQLIRI